MKQINWVRVLVLVNASMTGLLFYLLLELHKVVDELGLALQVYAQVLAYVVQVFTGR